MKRITVFITLLFVCQNMYAQQLDRLGKEERNALLSPPLGKVDVVLDTDTYNEIDDQFALVYALLSKERINLKAVHAAPFSNQRSNSPGDGMEKSYQEILRIYDLMGIPTSGMVFKGSNSFLMDKKTPIESPAADHLIKLSENYSKDHPLYVVAVGAITNVASAILKAPEIASRIVLIWVAGNSPTWPKATEFNSGQDLMSSNIIFDSGIPLILLPARPVTTHLTTTLAELKENLSGKGQLADYLLSIFKAYQAKNDRPGASKVVWDIVGIAWLINADWIPSKIGTIPNITKEHTYRFDKSRHDFRYAYFVNRDPIFNDLFNKINNNE